MAPASYAGSSIPVAFTKIFMKILPEQFKEQENYDQLNKITIDDHILIRENFKPINCCLLFYVKV